MPDGVFSPEQLKASARRLAEEVVNQGDLAAAAQVVSPDCLHHALGDHPARGVSAIRDRLVEIRRAFPDFHVIVEQQIAEGPWVAQRVSLRGTHDGEFLGIAPTGRTVSFDVMELCRAGADGRFVEHGSSLALLDVLRQLGVASSLPASTTPFGSKEAHRP